MRKSKGGKMMHFYFLLQYCRVDLVSTEVCCGMMLDAHICRMLWNIARRLMGFGSSRKGE